MPECLVQLSRPETGLLWQTRNPVAVDLRAGFGAEPARAVCVPPPEDLPDALLGDELIVRCDDRVKFRGPLVSTRTDTAGWPLTLVGERHPRQMFRAEVRGRYTNQTATDILRTILDQTRTGLRYTPEPEASELLDCLDFRGEPLFYAIDLLARLAGNWLWDVNWTDELRFVPPDRTADRVLTYHADRWVAKPGQTTEPVRNLFQFSGGATAAGVLERYFQAPASIAQYGPQETHLFARAVRTATVADRLKAAVLAALPEPGLARTLDRWDGDLSLTTGDRVELRGAPLPLFPEAVLWRVAREEIRWRPASVRARYTLAAGLESATRYTRYLDHDPTGVFRAEAQLGTFQLDLSALDSDAHLDHA